MFKVLIADDEPKIRRGLLECIDWKELDMTVVGVAKDGEEALEMARKNKPDICLLDICMPHINGLEMIESLRQENHFVITIVITGYDEFEYAQKAVKLNVFDYILKPINEHELLKVLLKAKKQLMDTIEKLRRYEWANIQLKKNMPVLRERFVSEWLYGNLSLEEVEEQFKFHDIEFTEKMGIILLKTQGVIINGEGQVEWERQLLIFAIQNIFEEMLEVMKPFIVVRDTYENLVALVTVKEGDMWNKIKISVIENVHKYLKHRVQIYQELVENHIEGVPEAYEKIKKSIHDDSQYLPIIRKVKSYMEQNFANQKMSLQTIADDMQISMNYLSRLYKQEKGMTFIDYLIRVRIKEAIKLMNDPCLKIYEIADKVGYSSQHYFCVAFKKVLGVSPTEYRQKRNYE